MQWCRPSPEINSGRTLIPSDVILKTVVIRSRSSGVKSVIFNPFSWTKKRRKIFRESRDGGFLHTFCKSVFLPPPLSKTVEYLFQGVGTEDFHTFFASQLFFYTLFLDSRKIFEGVGMENFHTFFASQSFYSLVLGKRQGNNTAYDRIAATIWVTVLALN